MNIRILGALTGALIASIILSGCANTSSGGVYSGGQTRQEMTVRMGVVESVRKVTLEGSKSGVGAVTGAAIGGIAGSNVGGGKGQTAAAIIGAVAGGLAGNMLEEQGTRKVGLEITIKLDNGNLTAITQEADEEFRPGERVRILSGGGVTRVSH